jgi:hypothetical protein
MKTATKPKAAPTASTPAPAAGIRKINLGGIAAKTEKKTTEYPALPDPTGDVAKLASEIIAESRDFEVLEGSLKIKKAELRAMSQEFYFQHLHGKHEIPSSVEAKGENPEEKVLVTFSSRYSTLTDEYPLIEALGPELTAQFFRQSFELKIDGDKIPADRAEELINEIQTLFASHNCPEALSAKAVIKPTPDFHTGRHTALSVEENLAVDAACPIIAMVKTKGRKGK